MVYTVIVQTLPNMVRPEHLDVVRIFESDVCDVDMVENPDSVIFDVDSCFQAHNI